MSKVIVIIGGSDGIGKTTLVKLLADNNIVYNLSRTKIERFNNNIYCDVSKTETIKYAIDLVLNQEKRIDALIYSAGFSMASTIEEAKEEDYRYLFEVILFGYIETLKCIIPNFKVNNGGRVIFMSSLASSIPIPFDPYYSAAKSAVEVFNNTVNIELNKNKIFLTNLIFGGVKTNFTFKRKINSTDEQNFNFYNSVNSLAKTEQIGKNTDDIAKAAIKVLSMNKPPQNYLVGLYDKVAYKLSRILPSNFINKIVKLKFKIEN